MDADGSVNSPDDLAELYRNRFDEAEVASKRVLWGALCSGFFQAYVPEEGSVVDLGAGNCEFTNAIRASRRIAVDLNPETKSFADAGVTVLETSSTDLSALEDASIDPVFTSNFFEHLPSKTMLLDTLQAAPGVADLRPADARRGE